MSNDWLAYLGGAVAIAGGYYLWHRYKFDEDGRAILRGNVTSNEVDAALRRTETATQGGQAVVAAGGITVTASQSTGIVLPGQSPSVIPAGTTTTISAGVIANPNPTPAVTPIEAVAQVVAVNSNPSPPATPKGVTGTPVYSVYNASGGTSAFRWWQWKPGLASVKEFYNQSPRKIIVYATNGVIENTIYDSSTPSYQAPPVYQTSPPPSSDYGAINNYLDEDIGATVNKNISRGGY